MRQALAFGAVLIIVAASLGGLDYYTYSTLNNQLASTKASLGSQVAALQSTDRSLQASVTSLQGTVASLQSTLTQNQQAQSSTSQQVGVIQGTLQSLQGSLSSLSSELNSMQTSNAASQQQVSSQLKNISGTIQTLSAELASLTPQVPLSTLVIVNDTYDNASKTFQFTVQNTQNFTVYAQLSATFWGTSCLYYNGQGSYLSQVYTFNPLSNTVTTLNLNLGAFQSNQFCGHTPVVYLTMSYVAAASTSVSQTYTFNVIPYFTWP